MDIDDDRILNIDTSDVRRLNAFKVPKKNIISKSSFDKLSLDSSEFKSNIYSKVINGFKTPSSSSSFKPLSAYNICNVEVETIFNKRKQYFKKEYSPQSSVEYFGFIYISNLGDLRRIVNHGRVKNGNLHESVLGQADMGVSVCQYSDIFHPGDNKNYPRNGFLLIVKYLRGRVCYVVEDNNPMEPQPNYDCHMSKVYNHESFPSMGRAFHTTQVYLYEYSEDFDLIEQPSHVMPWAAVEFVWGGLLLYKLISVPIAVTNESSKDSASKNNDKRIRLMTRPTGSPSQRIKQSYTDCTAILCTQLQLKLPNIKDDSLENVVLDIPATILSYHSSWNSFAPLMTSSWQIADLIEWMSFEQEFLRPLTRNTLLNDTPFSLNDVFNKRVTISRTTESCHGAHIVNYLRLVVNDPSRDRAKMARLIDHFHETKTVGRIRLCDDAGSLLFVFPDSTLSQNFGIPSVKTLDVNYLHVLLITEKSLAYNNSTNELIDKFLEIELKTSLLKLHNSQSIGANEPLVPNHVLKQSLRIQNHIQKSKLREMCGSAANGPLKFEAIDFEYREEAVVEEPKRVVVSPLLMSNGHKMVNGRNEVEVEEDGYEMEVNEDDEEENEDDRPYDPTENLTGLADVNTLKKLNESRRTEPEETPASKLQKRADEKSQLNDKLYQLLTKIESPPQEPIEPAMPRTLDIGYFNEDDYAFDRSSSHTALFFKPLDKNRFQTKFRNGISEYIPEPDVAPPPQEMTASHDRDLRFRGVATPRYQQQFQYHDHSRDRYNGFNR